MKYEVIQQLEIRSEPSFETGNGFGVLYPGFVIDTTDEIETDERNISWVKDINGFYYEKDALREVILGFAPEVSEFNINLKAPWLTGNFDVGPIWSRTTGKGITVAILDSGIFQHEDLVKNIDTVNQKTFISNSIMDNDGHGTHIAGIVGANGTINLIGVAPSVGLLPIKIVEKQTDKIDTGRLINAIEYVASLPHVNIINMSLKANHNDPMYEKLKITIQNVIANGKIFVAASGNDWGHFVSSPANLDNVLAISAVKRSTTNPETYELPLFANYGKRVDTCTIGHEMLSCGNSSATTSLKNGTSMASAYMSGLIALKLQLLMDKSIPFSSQVIIEKFKTSIFGFANRPGTANVSLPVVNPIKFLTN